MSNILIIGATSAIAKELARSYADQGNKLFVVARNPEQLDAMVDDLRIRGAGEVGQMVLDCNDFDQHELMLKQAIESIGDIDIALICHGSLPVQSSCESDFQLAHDEINTNGLSVISLLTSIAAHMSQRQQGTIAVITSVAGDRGRASNFVYGAAKALVSTYLQGLRGRLLANNVHVVDIKPGFVDTPMTAGIDKRGPLWSSPKLVATIIEKSISNKRHTVYAPFYWRYIMLIVCSIPEFIFKKLKI